MNGAIGGLLFVIAGLLVSYFVIHDLVRAKGRASAWRENGRRIFIVMVLWALAYVFYKYRMPVSHGFGQ
jgi:uncharacterized membrane protein